MSDTVRKPMKKRCTRCLYDKDTPKITFDSNGVCNYCHTHDQFDREYPIGAEGKKKLHQMSDKIKKAGRGKKHNVIVGVSGGCDSSYLLYITKLMGLRPLAVYFDNNWNKPVATKNIRSMTKAFGVDLYSLGVDKGEYDDICRSFLKSGTSDIDIPNDIALTATLYKAAEDHDIKYIFIGHSFRTEGITPLGWTYMDGRYIKSVQKKYGTCKLETFPNLWLKDFFRWVAIKRIKRMRPLYYVDYIKEDVKKMLTKEFGWEWYGGHHMENYFTSFHSYFWRKRYKIDMRLLGYSALVRSGQITRKQGLELISQPHRHDIEMIKAVRKRLGLTKKELKVVMKQPEKTYRSFKTYKKIFEHTRWFWWLMYKLNRVPKSFYIKYTMVDKTN